MDGSPDRPLCGFCEVVCETLAPPPELAGAEDADCRDILRRLKSGELSKDQVVEAFARHYGDDWALRVVREIQKVVPGA